MGYRIYAYFQQFKNWHQQLDKIGWLSPYVYVQKPAAVAIVSLCLIAALCSAWMNINVRAEQYQKWSQNPAIFALEDGTPLYTTTDAPYFVGKAQAFKEQGSYQQFDARRVFPVNRDNYGQSELSDSIFDTQLLVVLLAWLSEDASPKSLLEAGHLLIPITAGLTAIMVMLAFGAGGFWLEGAIAGAGGGLCFANLVRTGAGRIDTDQLNVGFFYLLIAFAIWAARAKEIRHIILLTFLACVCNQLLLWWYSKAIFGWMAAAGLFWCSLYYYEDMKRSSIQCAFFICLGGIVTHGLGVGDAYLVDSLKGGTLIFPNTFDTITEISKRDWPVIATSITGSISLAIYGVIGYVLFCLRYPHIGGVYAPAILFIFASFIAGNRMIFYAAPVVWFGVGWLSLTLLRLGFSFWKHWVVQFSALGAATLGCLVLVWVQSPTDLLQRPSFPAPIIQALASPTLQKEQDAVLASWWDYGYSALLFNNGQVFHDGGSQTRPRTHYIARGLLSSSPAELASILKFIAADGEKEIFKPQNDVNAIEEKIKQAGEAAASAPIYLFLTRQMSQWMPSIGKLGAYDTARGKAFPPPNVLGKRLHGYLRLDCVSTAQQYRVQCGRNAIQLDSGLVDGKKAFSALVQAEKGKTAWAKQFDNPMQRPVLFIEQTDNLRPEISAMGASLFFSNHHQMFHLGNINARYFELVEDNYPHSRLYKVK